MTSAISADGYYTGGPCPLVRRSTGSSILETAQATTPKFNVIVIDSFAFLLSTSVPEHSRGALRNLVDRQTLAVGR